MEGIIEGFVERSGGSFDKQLALDLLEDFGLYPNAAVDAIFAVGAAFASIAGGTVRAVYRFAASVINPITNIVRHYCGGLARAVVQVSAATSSVFSKGDGMQKAMAFLAVAYVAQNIISRPITYCLGEGFIGTTASAVPNLIGYLATTYGQFLISAPYIKSPVQGAQTTKWMAAEQHQFLTHNRISDGFDKDRRKLDALIEGATGSFTTLTGLCLIHSTQWLYGATETILQPGILGISIPWVGPGVYAIAGAGLGGLALYNSVKLMTTRLNVPMLPEVNHQDNIQSVFTKVVEAAWYNRKLRPRDIPAFKKAVINAAVPLVPVETRQQRIARAEQEVVEAFNALNVATQLRDAQRDIIIPALQLELNNLADTVENAAARALVQGRINAANLVLQQRNDARVPLITALNEKNAALETANNAPEVVAPIVPIGAPGNVRADVVKTISILTVSYLLQKMTPQQIAAYLELNLDQYAITHLTTASQILRGTLQGMTEKQKKVFFRRDLERKAEKVVPAAPVAGAIMDSTAATVNVLAYVGQLIQQRHSPVGAPNVLSVIEHSINVFNPADPIGAVERANVRI